MNQIIINEKKYLEHTENIIDSEIIRCSEIEKDIKDVSIKLSFEDRLRGTHLNLNSELFNIGEKINRLERSKDCPYFGRIDYKREMSSEVLPIYIGKSTITHNDVFFVYDWRSPICGLYYDSEVGPVSYISPSGIQYGDLLLKRQIIIKNRELIGAVDSDLVTNDELLVPYLNVNADNRMKTIIASIQKEQNSIIRSDNDDIIVQGVAGSGKTSVALHRISYLIYLMGEKVKPNNFLIIGPNEYFLNYISSVLPDLETTPVEQKTLLKLMNDYIGANLTLCENALLNDKEKQKMQKKISAFKGSFEYRDLLDKFANKCLKGDGIISNDFCLSGKVVFPVDMIKKRLFGSDGKHFNLDATHKYYKLLFRENIDDIYAQLNKENRDIYISLPKDDPIRKEYVDKSAELNILVKKQGEKILDKYFESMNKSCLNLYVSFICELDKIATSLTAEEIIFLQKDTLKTIRKKKISFEDIASLIYLNYILTNKRLDYKNVVIDEAQDYSIFGYYALKQVLGDAKFNLYGDIAQAIYPYRSINSWEELSKDVFDNKATLLELSKSYRTTIEITEAANNVLTALNLHSAEPVIRHGATVKYIDIAKKDDVEINKVYEWLDAGYKTIAVICKNEQEAKKVQEKLVNSGINSKYISNNDNQYTGGVFVMTVASAKGLEFDCVIVNDASNIVYDSDSNVDMHLLYVASTRALHEQVVLYNKEITKPFKKEVQNSIDMEKNKKGLNN